MGFHFTAGDHLTKRFFSGYMWETIQDRAIVSYCETVIGNHMCSIKP